MIHKCKKHLPSACSEKISVKMCILLHRANKNPMWVLFGELIIFCVCKIFIQETVFTSYACMYVLAVVVLTAGVQRER